MTGKNNDLRPSIRFYTFWGGALLLFALLAITAQALEFHLLMFFTELPYFFNFIEEMTPPNLAVLVEKKEIATSLLETLSMAFLATLFGGGIALVLAFLAANNTSPFPVIRIMSRIIITLHRVIPSLVFILLFVILVGLGPFAGVLALGLGTIGLFGKLMADLIEEVDMEPVQAMRAIGATKTQGIVYGMLPQLYPALVGNVLYTFDVTLRSAIVLGIFGGGGIGYEIHMAMKLLQYQDALALILMTISLVVLLEQVSNALRARILRQD